MPWQDLVKEISQLRDRIEADGFTARVNSGAVEHHGHHIELAVEDKRSPRFANGQPVKFRFDLRGGPVRCRVNSSRWNASSREFDYVIESESGGKKADSVSEPNLSPA